MKTLKFKNLSSQIFLLIAIIFLAACSKEKRIENDIVSDNSNIHFRSDPIQCPTIDNDVLVFQDSSHFFTYYAALSDLYDVSLDSFDSIVYACYNGIFTSVYKLLEEDEFVSPEDRYRPFLTDPVMQSIVNSYFEFRIGGALITYMNNDVILNSEASNINVRTAIRALPKGIDIDTSTIPDGAFWGPDTEKESFIMRSCKCSVEIEQISCTEVRVWGNCLNLFWQKGRGEVTIEYSQSPSYPSGIVLLDEDVKGNWEFVVSVPFNPNYTSHFINVKVDPNCLLGSNLFESLRVVEQSCDFRDKKTDNLWVQDNGIQGFTYLVSNYKTVFGSYEESKMWSKYWNGTRWTENNSDLEVSITASRRKFACVIENSESQSKSKYRKALSVRINCCGVFDRGRWVKHCNGDVFGNFKKTLNWNGTTWTIDATSILNEFDYCCP